MSDSSTKTTVYFVCPNCNLPYRATQELRPEQLSGRFECEECRKPVHEWAGHYDLSDWRAIRMKPVVPGAKI
jgi:transcription initiation factor IIE alpha subunit